MIIEFNKLFRNRPIVGLEKQEEVVEQQLESIENDVVKNVEYLKTNNIDVDHGLELLGDIELYNETFNDFSNEEIVTNDIKEDNVKISMRDNILTESLKVEQ